jgi:ferredoxin
MFCICVIINIWQSVLAKQLKKPNLVTLIVVNAVAVAVANLNSIIDMACVVDKNKCIGCGACEAICPHNAIKLVNGKSTIDSKKCVSCGTCVNVCPVSAITNKK